MIGRATYTVSADGRTLTIVDGYGDSVIVLDRLYSSGHKERWRKARGGRRGGDVFGSGVLHHS